MTEKWKTKCTVWDDLRTALNPEKKLRTAETEIYPSLMSNGAWDWYMYVQGLGSRSRDDKGVLKTHWILTIVVLQWARKFKIRVEKNISVKILVKINFLMIFWIFIFLVAFQSKFLIFAKFQFWSILV